MIISLNTRKQKSIQSQNKREPGSNPRPFFLAHIWRTTSRYFITRYTPTLHDYTGKALTLQGFAICGKTSLPVKKLRRIYDKHQDQNIYTGLSEYGTTGIINSPDATESTVADGASGNGNWVTKTPAEILKDVNTALTTTWEQAGYDLDALPNHILLPYEEYNYILNTPVSDLATKSIYDYIMENNIANKNGGSLFIGATQWCKGAGTGGTDRMVVYVNHEKYLKADELVPLSRIMSAPNVANVCYDTAYMANLSEVEVMYPQTITYWDQIGGDT